MPRSSAHPPAERLVPDPDRTGRLRFHAGAADRPNRAALACVTVALVLVFGGEPPSAEKLSLRQFRVADGLASDVVRVVRQDSKGYLWIGTGEGISRFDGFRFVNYSSSEGLTVPLINDIAEDARGRIWVAANGGGLVRFVDDPGDASRLALARDAGVAFVTFQLPGDSRANQINALALDGGTAWCATDNGLYHASLSSDGRPSFARVAEAQDIVDVAIGPGGAVWFAGRDGVSRLQGGRVSTIPLPAHDRSEIRQLLDYRGQLVVMTEADAYRLDWTAAATGETWVALKLPLAPKERIQSGLVDAEGLMWAGTTDGVLQLRSDGTRRFGRAEGLPPGSVQAFYEDRDRNVWMGTALQGLVTVNRQRLVSYGIDDGLPEPDMVAVTEGAGGAIHAVAQSRGWITLIDDRPALMAGSDVPPLNSVGKRLTCDGQATCWALADDGLYQLDGARPAVSAARLIVPRPANGRFVGFSGRAANGLYRDAAGVLWLATDEPAVYRVSAGTNPEIRRVALTTTAPMAPMAVDRSGTLWLANMTGIGRLKGGQIERLEVADGARVEPRAAFVDSRGWLWVGLRYAGVVMTRDPTAAEPQWTRYSTRDGLASNSVWALTEDRQGRMYLATNRGLDRLDPDGGEVEHFTRLDGLAGDLVTDCFTDSQGRIWLATSNGLSRLDPLDDSRRTRVPTYIDQIEVADARVPLPLSGAAHVPDLRVPPGASRITIHYAGVSIGLQRPVRYQYRLEGLEPSWSEPTTERAVTYARLGPGAYRFLVRAVDAQGALSTTPAVVEFTVLPPFWRRWYFIASVLAVLAAAVSATQRQRARRTRAAEAFRRQVATDLHDDVGSGLSQIAILSEVLTRQHPQLGGGLHDIAGLARTLRDSMSDIVWAVGPGADRISDLVNRMRQAAFTLLDFDGLRVQFAAPPAEELDRAFLAAARRRQVLLIFKEAMTNVARHAQASQLDVVITIAHQALTLSISDNGRGFVLDEVKRGQGLDSLFARAKALDGALEIDSRPGEGTTLRLTVPLGR